VAILNSLRAKKHLENLKHILNEKDPVMKKYPGDGLTLWANLEREQGVVKKLSFFGELQDFQKVILESMASLLIGKPIAKLDDLSIRECEAFLRDRNSEPSITEMTENEEKELKKVFQWIRAWPQTNAPKEYSFPSEKGLFRNLKLVEKIKEIKAFLNSPEILTLYQGLSLPELVDVEDLTVYIHAPYESQREKSLFEELHLLGVEVFQEENLNFIPEAL